ncbi:MAG: hypothetical protein DI537_20340 [Stutzerimonas stutzeri]|nr:MAG: hypothetical protein DI537_20340 [Stutzerimonas stutzeri]
MTKVDIESITEAGKQKLLDLARSDMRLSYDEWANFVLAPVSLNQWVDSQVNGTMAGLPEDVRAWAAEIARGAAVMVFANKAALIDNLVNEVHAANVRAGWWNDLHTGEDLHGKRNVGELLCLVHSEISEAMEGHRKGLSDDKLPHRPMFRVELIDALIRIFDILGAANHEHSAGTIFVEKMGYNAKRIDHTPAHRRQAGGKAF